MENLASLIYDSPEMTGVQVIECKIRPEYRSLLDVFRAL